MAGSTEKKESHHKPLAGFPAIISLCGGDHRPLTSLTVEAGQTENLQPMAPPPYEAMPR